MITAQDVADYLAVPVDSPTDAAWLGRVVGAVNEWVAGLPVVQDRPAPADPWPEAVTTGALMLAGHIYQGRNSPNGRPTLEGTFTPAYADPEISRLLELGPRWSRPRMLGIGTTVRT